MQRSEQPEVTKVVGLHLATVDNPPPVEKIPPGAWAVFRSNGRRIDGKPCGYWEIVRAKNG